MKRARRLLGGAVLFLGLLAGPVAGQERPGRAGAAPGDSLPPRVSRTPVPDSVRRSGAPALFHLRGINVTASRTAREVLATAASVTVLPLTEGGSRGIERLRAVPGLELDGVGPVRRQPVIRGFGGQRVLVLEDGIRVSNSRRRMDSTEPLGVAGVGAAERLEVVRGPASVLHGSEAIGGVLNVVGRRAAPGEEMGGRWEVGGSSAGDAGRAMAEAGGAVGPVGVRLSAGLERSQDYRASAGRFGDVTFEGPVRVHDTGGEARWLRGEARWAVGGEGEAFLRIHRWDGDATGFGWVDPALLGGGPRVRITMPRQDARRGVAGWRSGSLGRLLADRVEVTGWLHQGRRTFVTDVLAPLGPPGASLEVESTSRTEVGSRGVRVEARRRAGAHAVTWGLEAHRERATGADSAVTTVRTAGSTRVTAAPSPAVPDATLTTVGVFLQDLWRPDAASEVTLGVRWQDTRSRAAGPGEAGRAGEGTVVGAAGLVRELGGGVSLVASLARGFRSPNLVERFYEGPTPGGRGVWVRNPELGAETSLGADLGVRLRRGPVEAELFAFHTELEDGIRLEPTGRQTEAGPEYRNENVERLRVRGVESWARGTLPGGVALYAGFTLLDRSNPDDREDPLVEGARVRVDARLSHRPGDGRLVLEWASRWQAGRRLGVEAGGPVGETMPAFVVHDLRATLALPRGQGIGLALDNVFDRLYAESGNVAFFRPEPGRSLRMWWTVGL